MNKKNLEEAYKILSELKEQIIYKNRFFCKNNVLDRIREISKQTQTILPVDTTLFRARIYTQGNDNIQQAYARLLKNNIKLATTFHGYNKENSLAPIPNKVTAGRANPDYISYLYTARDMYTALVEVKPRIENEVSIATLKTLKDINLTKVTSFPCEEKKTVNFYLQLLIGFEFANVANNQSKDYIFTQFLSELYKDEGYDAIEFKSSLNKNGRNITIFDPNMCDAIASEIYKVDNIYITALCDDINQKGNLVPPQMMGLPFNLIKRNS
ncbi:MAG: RES family NAD+ phosphorylase [Aminipila sp.]